MVSDSVIDRSAATTVSAHRRSFEQLFETERRRRARRPGCRLRPDGDAAVEQELDRVDGCAAFVQRASLFVADLPAEPRQPEQLVDVR